MNIYRNTFTKETDADAPRGVALGNFDGIHIGHATLIRTLVSECRKRNLHSCVYTFENHPNKVLFKDKHTPLIMTEEQKAKIIEEMGVDELFLEYFDENYADTTPEMFVDKILIGKLNVKLVIVGYDYTYGKKGKGKVDMLKQKGEELGFEVIVIPQIKRFLPDINSEVTVSSTVLRELITHGNMNDYRELTGRNYSIPGNVAKGRNVGKKLGFPTANILPKEGFALPEFGVYATITHTKKGIFRSITNIGNNPTFTDIKTVTVETHIIGFKDELYGQDIEVEFIEKMRGEISFSSVEELKAQIDSDLRKRKDMCEGIQKVYERNGVEIFYVPTDLFKTSMIKIMICDNLSRESAYKNGLLPEILSYATKNYPSKKDITLKMLELYGANVFGTVSCTSEVQFCEFRAEYVDSRYIPDTPELENEVIEFLFEIIFNALTDDYDGKEGFVNDIFSRERDNRNVEIKSIINDKYSYAALKFKEIMFKNEPYSIRCIGTEGDGDNLTPVSLYEYYKNIFLQKLPVKIVYSGKEYPQKLTEYTEKFFKDTERIPLNEAYVERTEIKPDEVKNAEDEVESNQSILIMGYRTNAHPLSSEYYAAFVCKAILGQGASSKMFVNIREKNSLAYHAGAACDRSKGFLYALCGIDAVNKDKVISLVEEQIEAIRQGDFTDEEFDAAIKMLCDDLYSYVDNQEQMMSYYFNQHIMGKMTDTLEYIARIKDVKKEDVIVAAKKLQLDTIYFLKGEEKCDE